MAIHQRHSTVAQRLSRIIAAPFREMVEDRSAAPRPPLAREKEDGGDRFEEASKDDSSRPRRTITRKTSQLPTLSKAIYHIDHYTSKSVVVTAFSAGLVLMLFIGAILGFPNSWVVTFEVLVSSVTLLMVFTIQHTQGREQLATQRKLDELLLATPGAAESLMMLEEAPQEYMLKVEEIQRVVRADMVDEEGPANGVESY